MLYMFLKIVLKLLTWDAEKAFDTVSHEIMLNKMFHDGIRRDMWVILKNIYTNMTLQVKWEDQTTQHVNIQPGIRQGAKLSIPLYKRYDNTILNAIRGSHLGAMLDSCFKYYNLHMVGIAETHLTGNKGIAVDGYNWFGFNRTNIHVRAKTGSGGVGLLILNDICSQFNVEIIDNDTDGILWVRLEDKNCLQNAFCFCIVYLPPENSTCAVKVNEFFETFMSKIYTLPQGSPFHLYGDWNSRYSDLSDSIAGIDSLPERHVIDFHHNSYGSTFCDFLTDVDCCILNGPKTVQNDFTFVSSRGRRLLCSAIRNA
ncbi:unnamed protein product [Mytilus coruscus]|uniref:Reverse transcriptase domain-containing protein n=1 Tax=Mytilus coruscus TaxID=42192 RepID=A0A6J7ZZ55_MYTCO|nr:unnamed protein product [Mytilus coruscus]